jgi:hypothetical protein
MESTNSWLCAKGISIETGFTVIFFCLFSIQIKLLVIYRSTQRSFTATKQKINA